MSQYSLARSRLVKFSNLTSPTKHGFPIRGRENVGLFAVNLYHYSIRRMKQI